MNATKKVASLSIATALLFIFQSTAWATVVSDDFDDSSLDAALWTESGSGAMLESGTEVRFASTPLRNTLSTNATFVPAANSVSITGRVRIANTDGVFEVFTRVNPTTDGTINGHVFNGLYATLNNIGNVVQLSKVQNKVFSTFATSGSLPIDNGDVYDFTVTDDGTTLSATFTEISGANIGASVTLSDSAFTFTPSATSDRVGFSHREGRQDFLDFVNITDESGTAPEPSTLVLAVLGLVGLSLSRRRKRNA